MADELKWYLKLFDEVSGPADAAASSLKQLRDEFAGNEKVMGGFEKELKKTREEIAKLKLNPGQFKELLSAREDLNKMRQSLGMTKSDGQKLGEEFKGLFAGVGSFGIVAGANLLVSAGEKFAGFIADAGRVVYGFAESVIKASANTETITLAFESVLGKQQAAQALADIDEMAGKTKFDDDELKQAIRPLLLTGLSPGKEMADAIAAAVDAEVVTGGGIGAVQGTLDLIKKIRSKDGIGEKQLGQFGINGKAFFQDIATQLGISIEDAKKKVAGGDVGSDRILKTIYKSIADMQGGALGTAAEKGADTVEAKLHKLEELPGNFLKKMAASEGFAKLSDTLSDILNGLDPESENGKRIIDSLTRVFNDLMGWVKEFATPGRIEQLGQGIADAVGFAGELLEVLREVFDVYVKLVGIASSVASPIAAMLGPGQKEQTEDGVRQLVAGWKNGTIGNDEFYNSMRQFGTDGVDAMRDVLGIHSPSSVFEELGRQTSAGFAIGVNDGGVMDDAIRIPSASSAGGGIGWRGVSIDVGGIHIDGAGMDKNEIAAAVDERLTSSLLPKLAAALDTLAAQEGVQDG